MSIPIILVAAGTSSRLGGATHKALVQLEGAPLVAHTLRRLLQWPQADPVVVVGHPDDRPTLAALCAEQLDTGQSRRVVLVKGGARRQDSVAAGLAALVDGGAGSGDPVVLVHDAARPFVPLEPLDQLVVAAERHGCAVLAVPVADTLKQARPNAPQLVDRTVPRAGLWSVQTPQAFRYSALARLLGEAEEAGRTVTDEATLFEESGREVAFVEGSPFNFKITTAEDLQLARIIMAQPPQGAEPPHPPGNEPGRPTDRKPQRKAET